MQAQRLKEFVPPAWDDDSAYEGAEKWSYRQWAWEFLRRNVDFQTACNVADRSRGADHRAEGARFGRVDLRQFWRNYVPADDKHALWLAEYVEIVSNFDWGYDEQFRLLKQGQVALIFDLTQFASAGTAALGSMQARADELLRHAIRQYSVTTSSAAKPRQYKPVNKLLLEKYLRLYDAVEIFGVPTDATISVLYPQYWDKRNRIIAEGVRPAAHKTISKNLVSAREMVRRGYQTLVPLDVARAEEERRRSKE
jgi:hypothetical protein